MAPAQAAALLAQAVLLLVLGLPGALVLGHALHQIRRGRRTRDWPVVPGRIAGRRLSPFPLFAPIARGAFSYTYRVEHVEYVGRRIRFGSDIAFAMPDPARTWLGQAYAPGAAVDVAYDPHDPADSVLRKGASPGTYAIAACAAAMLVGGALLAASGV